ncbi:MAG: pteridine reductase [Candidatus Accumulibacter sp.]|nr:pteridine reductase [Accumulibacter sp.]
MRKSVKIQILVWRGESLDPGAGVDGKTVLVTGAAKRVGSAIARELHAAGARLMLHYRTAAADAEALTAELNAARPDSAFCVQADLLDMAQLPRLVAETLARFGRLDALVNNASSFYPTPLGSIDAAAWDDLIGSNLKAPLFLSQAAAPALRATRGALVNITDIHAERPLAGYPLYCAAKAGLLGLTRALAIELGPEVRVNAVAPGPVLWPDDGQFASPERREIVAHTLLKREGSPQDIARAVRFLLADAAYVTGQVLNVDGGRTAHL